MMVLITSKKRMMNLMRTKEEKDSKRREQASRRRRMKGSERKKKSEESSKRLRPSGELMKKDCKQNRTGETRSCVMKKRELRETYLKSRSKLQMKPKGPVLPNLRKREG